MKILLADDHKLMRTCITNLLQEHYPFAKIEEACNGKELVQKAAGHSNIDIIISDISMPLVNGIQAAIELEQINNKIPVILISTNSLEQHLRFAYFPRNIKCFIEKEYLFDEISETIDRVLEQTAEPELLMAS